MNPKVLRLILGDQLNVRHSWFSDPKDRCIFVMMEVRDEASYVNHHVQKIAAFFLAMRAFRDELVAQGYSVIYLDLDDPSNHRSLDKNIETLLATKRFSSFEYQTPDEYRVQQLLSTLCQRITTTFNLSTNEYSTEHFLTDQTFFSNVYQGHKRYVMESFYRAVRRSHDIFMDGADPIGGTWNFDGKNRSKLPAAVTPPPPITFPRDISEIISLLKKHKIEPIGAAPDNTITWPLTRIESLQTLEYFCKHLLEHFGSYQDAMHTDHRVLFHSRLSFALNVKLLSPKEVIDRAVSEWRNRSDVISIPQIEGFIRQIAGWREFIRGVYWAHMPHYKELNFFNATRALPHFYWDAETKMNCIHHAVKQSLEESYAHHIDVRVIQSFEQGRDVSPSVRVTLRRFA